MDVYLMFDLFSKMLASAILNCHFCLILNVSHKDHTRGVFPHLAEIEHRFPILVNRDREML